MKNLVLPAHLENHKAFNRTFKKDRLTFGIIAPFKGYANSAFPDMQNHTELVQMADEGGISTLWVRDVPFYDPNFGDVGQVYDPISYLGYLSAITKNIALGSAGVISTLRNPALVAKEASSIDNLSNGRFILGMSSGDRQIEYPAFGYEYENRGERFRENWDIIKSLTSESFLKKDTVYSGKFSGKLDLIPKLKGGLPMITIGRARQDMSWIAKQSDAWIWYSLHAKRVKDVVGELRDLGDGQTWKPFGSSCFLELSTDKNAPAQLYNNVYLKAGRNSLIEYWKENEKAGLSHAIINLKPTTRDSREVMQELIKEVLPYFQAE